MNANEEKPTNLVILRDLLAFCRNLKEDEFNFKAICSEYDEKNSCGTVCCLFGWLPRVSGQFNLSSRYPGAAPDIEPRTCDSGPLLFPELPDELADNLVTKLFDTPHWWQMNDIGGKGNLRTDADVPGFLYPEDCVGNEHAHLIDTVTPNNIKYEHYTLRLVIHNLEAVIKLAEIYEET